MTIHASGRDAVVFDVQSGFNVKIIACAGAGKTSLMLRIAEACGKKTVILTYNRALTDECNKRISELNLTNTKCHTIHSMFGICAGKTCQTDIDLLHDGDVSRFSADLVCIDESQDLRPTFYNALCRILPLGSQYVVAGDPHQTLYDFYVGDESTSKYLDGAPCMFAKFSSRTWVEHNLNGSYRMTASIADIASRVWGTTIHGLSANQDRHVTYLLVNPYSRAVCSYLKNLITTHGSDNVMILNRTVSGSGNPLRSHVNFLLGNGFRFHIKEHARGFSSDHPCNGMTRLWTYCASKGCEADIVVVFGVHLSSMGNDVGVAVSRAKRHLIIIHDDRHPVSPRFESSACIEWCTLQSNGNVVDRAAPVFAETTEQAYVKETHSVTDRIHLSPQILKSFINGVQSENVHLPLDFDCSGPVENQNQDMSCLYGKAIEYILQVSHGSECRDANIVTLAGSSQFQSKAQLSRWLVDNGIEADIENIEFPKSRASIRYLLNSSSARKGGSTVRFTSDDTTQLGVAYDELKRSLLPAAAIRMANLSLALDSYRDRLVISGYKWVNSEGIMEAVQMANKHFEFRGGVFEHELRYKSLKGRVDWMCGDTVVELKFCQDNSTEHQLQVVLYAAMHACSLNKPSTGILYNVRRGTISCVHMDVERSTELLNRYIREIC